MSECTERCFLCKRLVKQDEEEREYIGRFVNDGGLWFEAHGGWPSAILDPLVEETDAYVVFICEPCLRANNEFIYRVLQTRSNKIEILGMASEPSKHRDVAKPRCHGKYSADIESCRECRFRLSCRHTLGAADSDAVTGE